MSSVISKQMLTWSICQIEEEEQKQSSIAPLKQFQGEVTRQASTRSMAQASLLAYSWCRPLFCLSSPPRGESDLNLFSCWETHGEAEVAEGSGILPLVSSPLLTPPLICSCLLSSLLSFSFTLFPNPASDEDSVLMSLPCQDQFPPCLLKLPELGLFPTYVSQRPGRTGH